MSDKTKSAPVSDKKPRTKYKALTGLNYGDTRLEAGDVVEDLPEDSIGWLLDCNAIEKVK